MFTQLYFSSSLQRGGDSVVQFDKAKTRTKGRKRRANRTGLRILRIKLRILRIRDTKVQIMKQVMRIHSVDRQVLSRVMVTTKIV